MVIWDSYKSALGSAGDQILLVGQACKMTCVSCQHSNDRARTPPSMSPIALDRQVPSGSGPLGCQVVIKWFAPRPAEVEVGHQVTRSYRVPLCIFHQDVHGA